MEKTDIPTRGFDPNNPQDIEDAKRLLSNMNFVQSISNPLSQVMFRAGMLFMREYIAQIWDGIPAENRKYVASGLFRDSWHPYFDVDPGPPRRFHFDEVAKEVVRENGKIGWDSIVPPLNVEAGVHACAVLVNITGYKETRNDDSVENNEAG